MIYNGSELNSVQKFSKEVELSLTSMNMFKLEYMRA